jgi:hypothetical protein
MIDFIRFEYDDSNDLSNDQTHDLSIYTYVGYASRIETFRIVCYYIKGVSDTNPLIYTPVIQWF